MVKKIGYKITQLIILVAVVEGLWEVWQNEREKERLCHLTEEKS